MYAGWYFVIGSAVLLAVGLIILAVFVRTTYFWKEDYWGNDTLTALGWIDTILSILSGLIFLVTIVVCPAVRMQAREEYYTYLEQSQVIEKVLENGNDWENLKITDTIIEYNQGIAEAKADLKAKGVWSIWYGYDLDKLEYVRVEDKKEATDA